MANDTVYVIDQSTLTPIDSIALPAGSNPMEMTYVPSKNHLYVVAQNRQSLLVIDAATDQVVNELIGQASFPSRVVYDQKRGRIFTAGFNGFFVDQFDVATEQYIGFQSVDNAYSGGLAVNQKTGRLYIPEYQAGVMEVYDYFTPGGPISRVPPLRIPKPLRARAKVAARR